MEEPGLVYRMATDLTAPGHMLLRIKSKNLFMFYASFAKCSNRNPEM
jgi:hypothetical protein